MVNKNGDIAKFQLVPDGRLLITLKVQAKAEDGVSIALNSEFFDKKTRRYLFETRRWYEIWTHADQTNNTRAVFRDVKGQFEIPEVKEVTSNNPLRNIGYKIPELIDTMRDGS